MKKATFHLFFIICIFQYGCNNHSFKILREVAGPYSTNSYLIYDERSGQAALIDPGWKTDTLVSYIKDMQLKLKYILVTHGHADHYYYVPQLKKQFPEARWCLNREDYNTIVMCQDWFEKAYGKEWVNNTRMNPDESIYLAFDPGLAGEPDVFIKDGQVFRLGSLKINAIHTPGHSPGGTCFYTGNVLFSGDVLLYRSVGNLDRLTSNTEEFVKSVRKLYSIFPDSTIVYPGHNQVTDIGSEKKANGRISENRRLQAWWHLQ